MLSCSRLQHLPLPSASSRVRKTLRQLQPQPPANCGHVRNPELGPPSGAQSVPQTMRDCDNKCRLIEGTKFGWSVTQRKCDTSGTLCPLAPVRSDSLGSPALWLLFQTPPWVLHPLPVSPQLASSSSGPLHFVLFAFFFG